MLNQININDPVYHHREYTNDIGKVEHNETKTDLAKRVALVALPFIQVALSVDKSYTFALTMGLCAARTFSTLSQLVNCLKEGADCKRAFLESLFSIAALAANYFNYPLGLVMTSVHDLLIELSHFHTCVREGDDKKTIESGFRILNNILYTIVLLKGSLEAAVASFAIQALIRLYHSHDELRQGHWLEATGHFGMAMVRGHQLHDQINNLRSI